MRTRIADQHACNTGPQCRYQGCQRDVQARSLIRHTLILYMHDKLEYIAHRDAGELPGHLGAHEEAVDLVNRSIAL